jgi:hypothetical protein
MRLSMLKEVFILLLLFIGYCKSFGQFVVKDVLVTDPQASIFDPEYNAELELVCWKSDNNELWVCTLDENTRAFRPSNGLGTYVTGNLAPNASESWNGPEWMLSSTGTQIVYIKAIWGLRYMGIATFGVTGWQNMTLFQFPNVEYAMATRNYADSSALFLFETKNHDGIYWMRNNNFFQLFHYHDVTLGFFAYGGQQICCATNKARHPGFIETNSNLPFFTSISNDTIGAPFMWKDPESGKRLFMYRTNNNHTLKIFQEINPDLWVLYNEFNSPLPDQYEYITSPEPFVCGSTSYISFMAAQSGSGKDGLPAEIWIAAANPSKQVMQRVSDTTTEIRTDPEPVVFADSAFVYYTHVLPSQSGNPVYNVRKCDTGLANTTTSATVPQKEITIKIYPNPASDYANIEWGDYFKGTVKVDIYTMNGGIAKSLLLSDKQHNADLHELNNGYYSAHLSDGRHNAIVRFIIEK